MKIDIPLELPSERLAFALNALDEAEATGRINGCAVKPTMHTYGTYDDSANACFACLAGIAAFRQFGIEPGKLRQGMPAYIENAAGLCLEERLLFWHYERSIDSMRKGNVSLAFRFMGLTMNEGEPFDRRMPEYEEDPQVFHAAIHQLIEDLAASGY